MPRTSVARLWALCFALRSLVTSHAHAEEAAAHAEKDGSVALSHDESGFRMETKDGRFELRLFGIVQTDFRDYLRKDDRSDYEKFLVRRARTYIEGHVDRFEYRLMTDFGNGEPTVLDAFVDAKLWGKKLRLRAGKYKQPFSYEQFKMEDLTLVVFERSHIDVLAPARNVGVMMHGEDVFDRVDYAIGLSNGLRDSDFEEKRNEKDVVGRVAVRPFFGLPVLGSLQLGLSAAYGEETDGFDPEAFASPLKIRYFHFAEGVAADGSRLRMSPEASFFVGPLGFAAQYLVQRQEVANKKVQGPRVEVPIQGYYALATAVLTGERRTSYAEFVRPRRPVSLSHGWSGTGALELVLRTSGLWVGQRAFEERYRLVEPAGIARGSMDLTVGLNWYLNRWVWVQSNFEHTIFERPLTLGSGGRALGFQDALALRATVMF